ncbi:MAG: hypothetical protein VW644_10015 [Alphaproteobacteria bacterium]|jgi:hypothetical protein
MSIKRFNKTSAAILAGAAASIVGSLVAVDGDALAAGQTLLTALLPDRDFPDTDAPGPSGLGVFRFGSLG